MKHLPLLLIALAQISATAASAQGVTQITSPSGVAVNFTKCSGKSLKCMNRAGQHCGGSYQVLDSESHAGGIFDDAIPGPVTWYSMTFLCGASDGVFPQFPFRGQQFQMPSVVVPNTLKMRCTTLGNVRTCKTY